MTTFKQYMIAESKYGYSLQDVDKEVALENWKMIEKNCGPYLVEVRKAKDFLWRGVRKVEKDDFIKKSVKGNREPRFIEKDLHTWLDGKLKSMFGWKPRSEGVFTGGYVVARNYGNRVRMVFPIGKFKYIVMGYKNLIKLYDEYDRYDNVLDKEDVRDKIEEIIKEYSSVGLHKYLNEDEYECIVNCKEYYSVHERYSNYFVKEML